MKKQILLFGFDDLPAILAAEAAAGSFGAEVRPVPRRDWGMSVGALAEGRTGEAEAGPGIPDGQMLVFCGLDGEVQALLPALRRAGIGPACYKAVLTPTNRSWTASALRVELHRERAALQAGEKGKTV